MFRITVPPGRWRIAAFGEHMKTPDRIVTVHPGGTVTLEMVAEEINDDR